MIGSVSGSRRITLFFILLVALLLVSPGPGAGQEPGETYITYLPLVRTAPSAIYGRVTDCGIATPGVSLELRFYDGSAWSTLMTTVSDGSGHYRFQNTPALASGQEYLVRYRNVIDQSRLGIWETRHLTPFPMGSDIDLGSFDIANIDLNSPIDGYETNLPYLFSWTPRLHTPSDSYKFNLFNIYDDSYTPKFTTSPLGHTNSYSLTGLPPGFNYCNPYYWAITVNSPDGGWGGSLWAHGVTFYAQPSYSGIYGCVTDGGTPVSGVPVNLRRWNYMTGEDITIDTINTFNGVFSFTSEPASQAYEYYYVQYTNNVDPNRVALYETYLTSYQAGNNEHIGDFDIANIELGAPDGELVSLPYTFHWTSRPATASDDYKLDLFGQGSNNPHFAWYIPEYTDHYVLETLPSVFSPQVPYEWIVWVYDPFGGNGISYETHTVTFSSTGTRSAPADPQGAALPGLLERLQSTLLPALLAKQARQSQFESGVLRQAPSPTRQYPDYGLLNGER